MDPITRKTDIIGSILIGAFLGKNSLWMIMLILVILVAWKGE